MEIELSQQLKEAFGAFAEALENAAAAARTIEGVYANASAKSADSAADGVAGNKPVAGGKAGPAAKTVAAKPAVKPKGKPAGPTFDDVKTALTELMNAKSKESVKEILSEFGVAKLAELGEDSYADVLDKAREAMAPEPEPEGGNDDDDMFGS